MRKAEHGLARSLASFHDIPAVASTFTSNRHFISGVYDTLIVTPYFFLMPRQSRQQTLATSVTSTEEIYSPPPPLRGDLRGRSD